MLPSAKRNPARVWICCALLGVYVHQPLHAQPKITPSPAFSGTDLSALPDSAWITNGGNVFNQRYSPLTQINRDNVAELRALWRTGMGSGASFKNSGQTQILTFGGVL